MLITMLKFLNKSGEAAEHQSQMIQVYLREYQMFQLILLRGGTCPPRFAHGFAYAPQEHRSTTVKTQKTGQQKA